MTRRDDDALRPLRPRAAKNEVDVESLEIAHEGVSAQVGRPKYEGLTVEVGLHDGDVLLGDAATDQVGQVVGGQDIEVENDETHLLGRERPWSVVPEVDDEVIVSALGPRPGGHVRGADHRWSPSELDSDQSVARDRYTDLEPDRRDVVTDTDQWDHQTVIDVEPMELDAVLQDGNCEEAEFQVVADADLDGLDG